MEVLKGRGRRLVTTKLITQAIDPPGKNGVDHNVNASMVVTVVLHLLPNESGPMMMTY